MPSPAKQRRQVARADFKRTTGHTPTSAGYELPPDLLEKAVKRVGFLGLICALTAPLAYLTEYYVQPERILPGRVSFPQIVAVFLFILGVAVFGLAWSRRLAPRLMLDLGLIFEVIVALGISLSENSSPWPKDQPIQGISWNCLWISIFVVAVPGTYGKVVLATVASALMAPVGFAMATLINNNPIPSSNQLLILLLPNFVAAGWAIGVARYLHSLGVQVSKARQMGSYELIALIGRGGMGEVWRAEHRMLARASAIKLIRPEALAPEGAESSAVLIRRFEREARATAALRSPHTVDLYDFGSSDDGRFYYVMELLEGLDLQALVERFGPLPPARAIYLLQQVCKSLAEAHENGLVHRDIKPRNVFVCRLGTDYDFVKVLDFGLVKSEIRTEETQTALTLEGAIAGTPAYVAPEIATGSQTVDGRADLYSLGCVAYWLVTGCMVFEHEKAISMALAHIQSPPVPPSRRTEIDIPESLEHVILSCLEKDPAKRPQTARDLSSALGACEGVGLWTQEHAESWWRTHMPRTAEYRPVEIPEQAETW